jgi:hypothetical protein
MLRSVKVKIVFLLLLVPFAGRAQFLGLGGQYASKSDGQFAASFSFPTIHPKNPLNCFISSGLEYTTSGGAEMAGLNLKPLQLSWFGTEKFFNKTPFTLLLNLDAGYLLDFRHVQKDGLVLTPNLYVDYKYYFLKAGYDLDVTNGQKQFFVRAGVCLGLGTFKSFLDTQIW